jgi:release factor glutamine methyltransferase
VANDPLLDELTASLDSRREAGWLLDEVAGLDDHERLARARELAMRRRTGEPLQYVVGHWPFRELDLLVDRRALIPRPETEQLVGLALAALPGQLASRRAVDLGCGTGAIALSLAIEGARCVSDLQVHATDVSDDALALARRNAELLGADVTFHEGSWFQALPESLLHRVDLLCANPPYVSHAERPSLAHELDFEPELALVADDGTDGTPGFAAVETVVLGAVHWLAPGGTLLVEHGETHRPAALACAKNSGLTDVADLEDLAGRPRFLRARMP